MVRANVLGEKNKDLSKEDLTAMVTPPFGENRAGQLNTVRNNQQTSRIATVLKGKAREDRNNQQTSRVARARIATKRLQHA